MVKCAFNKRINSIKMPSIPSTRRWLLARYDFENEKKYESIETAT